MKTITLLNNKGGVGKTATVSAVGHILATVHKKKVLLVDLDPQANLSQMYGFDTMDEDYSLKDVIEGKTYPVENTVQDILLDSQKNIHECIYQTDYEQLDIIPAFITLSNVEHYMISDVSEPQQLKLSRQLRKVEQEYDYCLIDCAPSVSIFNVNALAASDVVYVPTLCDKSSRIGVANILRLIGQVKTFADKNLGFGGCILTRYDSRKKVCQTALEDCTEALGEKVILTIPVSTKIEQTNDLQKPLYEIDPLGKASAKYLELAEMMM